jgi:hypothetical protein
MTSFHLADSPEDGFFVWSARDGRGRGSCAVTGESDRATALMNAALEKLPPGATGSVRVVYLDRYASQPSYVYGRALVRIRQDPNRVDEVEEVPGT